jgi:hypothetical protein
MFVVVVVVVVYFIINSVQKILDTPSCNHVLENVKSRVCESCTENRVCNFSVIISDKCFMWEKQL